MLTEQLTIDGVVHYMTPQGVAAVTRDVMKKKPITYRSHRLLMLEIAKAWGFKIEQLNSDQKWILERLFDLSPDIERVARKVREDDSKNTAAAQAGQPAKEPSVYEHEVPKLMKQQEKYEDPFEALEKEMKRRDKRKAWRR